MPTVIIPDKICSHCSGTKWYVNQKTGQHICYKRLLESNKRYHTSKAGKAALKRAKQKQSENLTDYYIVNTYYVNAYVLHYFGIAFYEYSDKTLEQVCKEKGLNLDVVLKKMYSITEVPVLGPLSLNDYPVDLVIEFLKHSHHKFVKESLTYVTNLIQKIGDLDLPIVQDLKFVFPMFGNAQKE